MCVNYAPVQQQMLRDVFGVETPAGEWRSEAWPDYPAPIIRVTESGDREAVLGSPTDRAAVTVHQALLSSFAGTRRQRRRLGTHGFGRVEAKKSAGLLGICAAKPAEPVGTRKQDDATFLIAGLMEAAHERMAVCVERGHGEGNGSIGPRTPQAGNRKRLITG